MHHCPFTFVSAMLVWFGFSIPPSYIYVSAIDSRAPQVAHIAVHSLVQFVSMQLLCLKSHARDVFRRAVRRRAMRSPMIYLQNSS